MQLNANDSYGDAITRKKVGGMRIRDFRDFFVLDGYSYSISEEPVLTFTKEEFTLYREEPGPAVLSEIERVMVTEELFDELIMVFHGCIEEHFKHAATFLV